LPFVRFTRDRRGYEHFYLVEATTNRRGKTRARVLYWFRSPPNVKVGREPFDDNVRRDLEAQYPDIAFDWRKIKETPIPSADVERWRERRRIERAEKSARRALQADRRESARVGERIEGETGELADVESLSDAEPLAVTDELDDRTDEPDAAELGDPNEPADVIDAAEQQADQLAPTEESANVDTAAPAGPRADGPRRRRRRRRGRRHPSAPQTAGAGDAGAPTPDSRVRTAESREATAESREPTTESREPTTESREQPTESREQPTESHEQPTEPREQAIEPRSTGPREQGAAAQPDEPDRG
jgi:hypothetical protein